jgi:hypothetical protein
MVYPGDAGQEQEAPSQGQTRKGRVETNVVPVDPHAPIGMR